MICKHLISKAIDQEIKHIKQEIIVDLSAQKSIWQDPPSKPDSKVDPKG